ncbi:MAG: hypothetical protein KF788_05660 [Piscinibacter sp.]|nr:hypothetical protein [Piscinibacter sp.]
MMRRLLTFWLLCLPLLAGAAAPAGVVTIVDGEAVLLRGVAKAALAEGLRLAPGDIVETPAARLVRIELDDGLVVDLGPETRLQFVPRLTGDAARRMARLYLLQGWVKLTAGAKPGEGTVLASPTLDIAGFKRSAVLAVLGDEQFLFAESGEVTFLERSEGRAGPSQTLRSGEFRSRTGTDKASVAARPGPAFVQRVPRPFLDTLPLRSKQFAAREVPAKPLGPIVYDDVQAWIDAERALRGGFVLRWRLLARQSEFRRRLQEGMAAHPEWDRLLNPEKYLPKPASAPPSRPVSLFSPAPIAEIR